MGKLKVCTYQDLMMEEFIVYFVVKSGIWILFKKKNTFLSSIEKYRFLYFSHWQILFAEGNSESSDSSLIFLWIQFVTFYIKRDLCMRKLFPIWNTMLTQ